MTTNRLKLYFHTIINVKFIQLYYQLHYRFVARFFKPKINTPVNTSTTISLEEGILFNDSLIASNTFKFLNLQVRFNVINWNFSQHGKLWTYNLNYFDFLQQENISKDEGLKLINNFCASKESHLDGYEPYPISLRGMNWVKFLSKHNIDNPRINQQLYNDFLRLESKLEYHLLANHLLENGFGLLFGAYYFQDEKLYQVAKKLLVSQLKEQILSDGGHYELSPMYHSIILHRVLDCYNLVTNNNWKQNELASLFKDKASVMLGWLKEIEFINGELPMVNDSTAGITPSPKDLFAYSKRLHIEISNVELQESGYRKLKTTQLEVLFDVGEIAPSYQPGHSHADSLQIVLYSGGKPIIVDTGISTYEKNERRQLERSTSSHNTVTINNENSSQVWSGFRVAKRAVVNIITETENRIMASHNGYRALGVTHSREVNSTNDIIEVIDLVNDPASRTLIQGHLHFHPDVTCQLIDTKLLLNDNIEIQFPNETDLFITDYFFCNGFNDLVTSKKISYSFNSKIKFSITHL